MPVPQSELDAQQALILTSQLDLAAAITGGNAATILAARKALAVLVAQLTLILFEGRGFAPATRPGADYELIYQVAYALAPAF